MLRHRFLVRLLELERFQSFLQAAWQKHWAEELLRPLLGKQRKLPSNETDRNELIYSYGVAQQHPSGQPAESARQTAAQWNDLRDRETRVRPQAVTPQATAVVEWLKSHLAAGSTYS
eukprot:3779538-Alexandrium_andersonii.AAC.1